MNLTITVIDVKEVVGTYTLTRGGSVRATIADKICLFVGVIIFDLLIFLFLFCLFFEFDGRRRKTF
jgi:hypothetical protein